MARVLLVGVVIIQQIFQCDFKCVNSFATICEKISDISRYESPNWDILIIKNNECNGGRIQKNSEVLSAGIFNATINLEQLYISEKLNSIEAAGFFGLRHLQYLKLWGNQLKVLQRGTFSYFDNLKKLDISGNKIENLAHGWCENSVIQEIDLSFNQLTNIQVNMLDFESLKTVKLAHNRLSFMAAQCFNTNLLKLDISFNIFDNFREDITENLLYLRELNIAHNKLRAPPTFSKSHLSLETFDLSYNTIESIDNGALSKLFELKQLYLNNNNLKILRPEVFGRKMNIESLHLHANNLTSLSGLVGDALPLLSEITIGANPWYCECLLEIIRYIKNQTILLTTCEEEYFSTGKSPVCVSISVDCEKGERLRDDVYQEFTSTSKNYNCLNL